LAGTTARVKNLEDKSLGSPKENSSVAAVVAFYPPYQSDCNYPETPASERDQVPASPQRKMRGLRFSQYIGGKLRSQLAQGQGG
jgi:hypothetical protein